MQQQVKVALVESFVYFGLVTWWLFILMDILHENISDLLSNCREVWIVIWGAKSAPHICSSMSQEVLVYVKIDRDIAYVLYCAYWYAIYLMWSLFCFMWSGLDRVIKWIFNNGVHIVHPIYAAAGKSGACWEFCVFWAGHMMIIHFDGHTTREY
jgi:hypothetical protein